MSDDSIPTPPPAPGTPQAQPYPGAVPAPYRQPAPGNAVAPVAGYPAVGHPPAGYPSSGYTAPGYTAPGYGAPAYAPRPTSGVAIAAMVCGIVGFVFGWATFFIVIPILISVAAVILGHIALAQLKRTPAIGGRGMAITGLVLGYIPIGLTVILLVLGIIAAVMFGAFTIPFLINS